MYFPQDMTREDIEAFHQDMAEIYMREDELEVNRVLQEVADEARTEEIFHEWAEMVCGIVGVPCIVQ